MAIKSSIEKVSEQLVAKSIASVTGAGQDNWFDVRAQILANANALRPIVKRPRYNMAPPPLPLLTVVVFGTGNRPSAELVYTIPNRPGQYVFMNGGDTVSADEALQKLLCMTMVLLNSVHGAEFSRQIGEKWVGIDGYGGYWTTAP
ncbi:hypothetical protein LTR85_008115 [Meristemomyces frigidus]|nr:hypothetical protein LTR85_008115 [Meristemomyces frigidus]